MEPHSNSNQVKWFDRSFNFPIEQEKFPELLEVLAGNLSTLQGIAGASPDPLLNLQPFGKWSIKEHVGHLWLLESLWQKRLLELKAGILEMSSADLSNTETTKANFNQFTIQKLYLDFAQERKNTLQLLNSFEEMDFRRKILHPRLQQHLRVVDFMHFIAEHDLHHFQTIKAIVENNRLSNI